MNQEEKSLVQALHRGDKYACNDLVEKYSSKIYNVALRLTGHPIEAEEVLQETLINACKGAETFRGNASLGTWLYRIATNNGLMRLRRKKATVLSLDDDTKTGDGEFWPNQLHDWDWNPETVALDDELRQVMDDAVDRLPDSLRAAFVLRDLEGLSTKEAAAALNITPSNLKVRLHRARFLLREQLSLYFNDRGKNGGKTVE
ncbi:MAG: sigma-70 family RNA polymerase sigma factor [Chloroflexi bacterium]|nr:MAG: sigma-70 family RNA polymerase sigma factor [Chloroflexota bacterium]